MIALSAILALASLSPVTAAVLARSLSGEATFYGGNLQGGACSFSTYTLPSNIYGTALSDSNWDNSGNCGACVSVTGPDGNKITAMIVDECPGCGPNHLDLFPDAFAKLATPSKGVIPITWDYVDCPITSPLQLHNKDGVSAYWFSMQVVNANQAVSKLEVSTDGGNTWQGTTRQTYNFFEYSSGFGTTTVDVKVTAADGSVVTVKNVGVSSGLSVTAASNFGSSGSSAAISSANSNTVQSTSSTSATSSTSTAAIEVTASTEPVIEPTTQPISISAPLTSKYPVLEPAPVSSTVTSSLPGGYFAEVDSSTTLPSPSPISSQLLPSSPETAITSATTATASAITITVTACSPTVTHLQPSLSSFLPIKNSTFAGTPTRASTAIIVASSVASTSVKVSATTSSGLVKATSNAAVGPFVVDEKLAGVVLAVMFGALL